MLPERESRPGGSTGAAQSISTAIKAAGHDSTARADILAEVDALTESLRGYIVVQVVVDDEGHRRTYLYRSAAAAERCVKRARDRGRFAHVSICSLLPAGVVVGMGGGRS